jgi:hypothetical protein
MRLFVCFFFCFSLTASFHITTLFFLAVFTSERHIALFSDLLVFLAENEKGQLVPSLLMDLDKVWMVNSEAKDYGSSSRSSSSSSSSSPSSLALPSESANEVGGRTPQTTTQKMTHTSAVALLYPENSFFVCFDTSALLQCFVERFQSALHKQMRAKYANAEAPYRLRSFEYRLTNKEDDTQDVYQGEWQDGQMNGNGILRKHSGDVYTGHWRDGLFCEFGDVCFATGETYVGNWAQGLPHAMGKVTSDGKVYLGHFVRGQKSGRGKLTWDNGWTFNGQWENDLREGRGELRDPSGALVYAGDYHHDMMHGRGVLTTSQGVYEGELAFNDMHGWVVCGLCVCCCCCCVWGCLCDCVCVSVCASGFVCGCVCAFASLLCSPLLFLVYLLVTV